MERSDLRRVGIENDTDERRADERARVPLPWHMVETLPTADVDTIEGWDDAVAEARRVGDDRATARSLIGAALSRYWAHQLLGTGASWAALARERADLVDEASSIARRLGDADLIVESLLGRLHACWGPDRASRTPLIGELVARRDATTPDDLRQRIDEWEVLECFDRADLAGAARLVDAFEVRYGRGVDAALAARRVALWRANLAMLEGRLDEAVMLNEAAVSGTAEIAGSPSAFQNVAVVRAIERYLRRGLGDVAEAVRSIRASAVRVGANWDVAHAFTLAETGALDESREIIEHLATDDFASVPPDLNWTVTVHLIGLTVVHLADRDLAEHVLAMLEPHGADDATHGSGYASYGPNGRVVAQLCSTLGRTRAASVWLDRIIDEHPDGPWVALARLDRAASVDRPAQARIDDARRAHHDLQHWTMGGWTELANERRIELHLSGAGGPSVINRGSSWVLVHPTGSATLPAGVQSELLIRLLRSAGRDWSAAELEGLPASLPTSAPTERLLDDEARRAYRSRLRQLDELRSSGALDDPLEHEAAMLRRELGAARFATSTSSELERSRVRVATALRRCVDAVATQSPPLAGHLRGAITTGSRCAYSPADGATWTVFDL